MLVVDATVVVSACLADGGWKRFGGEDLISPPLAISEASSVLHEMRWRREIDEDEARAAIERLSKAPLTVQALDTPRRAWSVADELGWAKTYDAEYVALARVQGCRLVTLDERLRRAVRGLVEVIGPADLQ